MDGEEEEEEKLPGRRFLSVPSDGVHTSAILCDLETFCEEQFYASADLFLPSFMLPRLRGRPSAYRTLEGVFGKSNNIYQIKKVVVILDIHKKS